ncbi:50S ribosomal protein L32 [Candidatus Peregrinibacteria bacterium CG11_big_fil_rev_8_21_14_0_20_41_10]|nr:MAG: 50S ribosomal protein L32 [Candidatus Peregrinibacteria bacterium CG11_big_fil_rev_8_21_14_0_20_41_10]PIZ74944.1 MAG: 50S ribosomal protein L32 [Candidatus Peregrinibacteria bacterium CG_4_10_14_0_2_um_filter_41_8]PJC37951.1 MAG: 50S ribosomal protein L32 [Candidatus Peregrinibacteria bacterium CG_4_9_14_0_2_um_filter_41_14]
MAVPKKKTSKTRTRRRYATYVKKQQTKLLNKVALATCSNCQEKHRIHHICNNCGHYNGQMIIDKTSKDLDKITTIKA